MFPAKLIPVMVSLSGGIDPEKKVNEVTRGERQAFVRLIRHLPLTLTGLRDYREAIVTKGGVSVREVDSRYYGIQIDPGALVCRRSTGP